MSTKEISLETKKNDLAKFFIHSVYKKTYDGDCVIVKEQVENPDGTFTPTLKYYKNPKRSFYVTKPQFRTHKLKLELAPIETLDKYTSNQYDLPNNVAKALGIFSNRNVMRDLCASPYLYGADISIEALMKIRYHDSFHKGRLPNVTYGFLDIETSVVNENGEIILISFITCKGDVFTVIKNDHLYDFDENNNSHKLSLEEISEYAKKKVNDYLTIYANERFADHIKRNPKDTKTKVEDFFLKLNYHFSIHDKGIDLIEEIFKHIHREKMDFIGIWNMNFDIPKIMDAVKDSKFSYEDIFCPKEVPKDYKYVQYREDNNSDVSHFTLKWHWFIATSYSQFVDSMGLFSQCRKTQGFKGSYTLDNILKGEVQIKKMSLGVEESHHIMQTRRFKDYVAYNIFDVVGLLILENQNHDIFTMYSLSGVTPVMNFPRQTVKSTNTFYHKYLNKGKIIACASTKDEYLSFNKLFQNSGGAVLKIARTSGVGVDLLVA